MSDKASAIIEDSYSGDDIVPETCVDKNCPEDDFVPETCVMKNCSKDGISSFVTEIYNLPGNLNKASINEDRLVQSNDEISDKPDAQTSVYEQCGPSYSPTYFSKKNTNPNQQNKESINTNNNDIRSTLTITHTLSPHSAPACINSSEHISLPNPEYDNQNSPSDVITRESNASRSFFKTNRAATFHFFDEDPTNTNVSSFMNKMTTPTHVASGSLKNMTTPESSQSPTKHSVVDQSPRKAQLKHQNTMGVLKKQGSGEEQNGGKGGVGSSPSTRDRPSAWSKIFSLPLQRTRSAGTASIDNMAPPPHALFLHQKAALSRGTRKVLSAQDSQSDGVYEGGDGGTPSFTGSTERVVERRKKKSMMDVKEKFAFFRRQTDLSLGSKLTQSKESDKLLKSSNRLNTDQVKAWSRSFDTLLHDKHGLNLFREFLRTEFSDENVEFWMACEEYKSVSGQRKMHNKAQKIYNDYVAVQSKREVNLDSNTRQQTQQEVNAPNVHSFDLSQKRIQALMEKDSYQRFLRSDVYQNCLRECTPSSGSSTPVHTTHSASHTPAAFISPSSSISLITSHSEQKPAIPASEMSPPLVITASSNLEISSTHILPVVIAPITVQESDEGGRNSNLALSSTVPATIQTIDSINVDNNPDSSQNPSLVSSLVEEDANPLVSQDNLIKSVIIESNV